MSLQKPLLQLDPESHNTKLYQSCWFYQTKSLLRTTASVLYNNVLVVHFHGVQEITVTQCAREKGNAV